MWTPQTAGTSTRSATPAAMSPRSRRAAEMGGVREKMSRTSRPRSIARPVRALLLVTAGWAIAAAVTAAVAGTAAPAPRAAAPGAAAARPDSDPLVVGQKTTLAAARAAAGFPVMMAAPSSALAHTDLAQAWINPQNRQVALVLDQGKITIMMWPVAAAHKNAVSYFKDFIAHNHSTAFIAQVNDSPALVIEPQTDIKHSNPAWVEFYRRGVDINIYSASYGSRALLGLASTMK